MIRMRLEKNHNHTAYIFFDTIYFSIIWRSQKLEKKLKKSKDHKKLVVKNYLNLVHFIRELCPDQRGVEHFMVFLSSNIGGCFE